MRHHDTGSGEALVLLHGALIADWLAPVAAEPAVAGLRRIRLTRSGYEDAATAGTIAEHAAEHAALLRELGTGPARVLAHSGGCVVALQLALDHPDVVSELVLAEPPLIDPLVAPADREAVGQFLGPVIGRSMEAAGRGDLEAAYDTFMAAVCGPDHRAAAVAALGEEGLERALRDCGYVFTGEIPAIAQWTFAAEDAARITQPVLLVGGGESPGFTHRTIGYLAGLLPRAASVTIPGCNHLMPLTASAALAEIAARSADLVR